MDPELLNNLPTTREEAADMLSKVAAAQSMGLVKESAGWMDSITGFANDWQKSDPKSFNTAMTGLTGAGIGGVAGAAKNMFDGDENTSILGGGARGALLGGAVGAGGGAAYNYGPDALKTFSEPSAPDTRDPAPPKSEQTLINAVLRRTGANKIPIPDVFSGGDGSPGVTDMIPGVEALSNDTATVLGTGAAGGTAIEGQLAYDRSRKQRLNDFLQGVAGAKGKDKPVSEIGELAGELGGKFRRGITPTISGRPNTNIFSPTKLNAGFRTSSMQAAVDFQKEMKVLAKTNPKMYSEIENLITAGSADNVPASRLGRMARGAGYFAIPAMLSSLVSGRPQSAQDQYWRSQQ